MACSAEVCATASSDTAELTKLHQGENKPARSPIRSTAVTISFLYYFPLTVSTCIIHDGRANCVTVPGRCIMEMRPPRTVLRAASGSFTWLHGMRC